MRAFVIEAPGHGVVREVPVPRPGRRAGGRRVERAGVCGTDVELLTARCPTCTTAARSTRCGRGTSGRAGSLEVGPGVDPGLRGSARHRRHHDRVRGLHALPRRPPPPVRGPLRDRHPARVARRPRRASCWSRPRRCTSCRTRWTRASPRSSSPRARRGGPPTRPRASRVCVWGPGTLGLLTLLFCRAGGATVDVVGPDPASRELALRLGARACYHPDDAPTRRLRRGGRRLHTGRTCPRGPSTRSTRAVGSCSWGWQARPRSSTPAAPCCVTSRSWASSPPASAWSRRSPRSRGGAVRPEPLIGRVVRPRRPRRGAARSDHPRARRRSRWRPERLPSAAPRRQRCDTHRRDRHGRHRPARPHPRLPGRRQPRGARPPAHTAARPPRRRAACSPSTSWAARAASATPCPWPTAATRARCCSARSSAGRATCAPASRSRSGSRAGAARRTSP